MSRAIPEGKHSLPVADLQSFRALRLIITQGNFILPLNYDIVVLVSRCSFSHQRNPFDLAVDGDHDEIKEMLLLTTFVFRHILATDCMQVIIYTKTV